CLADADQDACGEGDLQAAGRLDCRKPAVRYLVRAAVGRFALSPEPGTDRLEHDTGARADLSQGSDVFFGKDARVHVWQEAGLAVDEIAHVAEVGERRGVASPAKPIAIRGVLEFRL